ncbi:MAG TPA: TraR/DksA C4-type zinc finger protein [Pseudonocardiaceae bacterium]|nr:TraR/DksA C4-type zinc finger protein [Pseudonocardiaceae bacterium]
MDDREALRDLLARERRSTQDRIASLSRQVDAIVESSAYTSNDDEHDPEGVTIAFERAQMQALLRQARADLEDLDEADERLRAGRYGVCEQCGRPIALARLEALPATRICIDCANRPRRRR